MKKILIPRAIERDEDWKDDLDKIFWDKKRVYVVVTVLRNFLRFYKFLHLQEDPPVQEESDEENECRRSGSPKRRWSRRRSMFFSKINFSIDWKKTYENW